MAGVDQAGIEFYRTLTVVSFTLLGLWFTVLRLAHGGWRGAARHRFTLHIALHFFLPGMIGMASQLSEGAADGGLFWRGAAVLAGGIGLVESLTLRRAQDADPPPPGWWLRRVDPVLYLAVMVVGVLPAGLTSLAPLQLAGAVTGVLFLVGLCGAWMAFAESEVAEVTPTPGQENAPANADPALEDGLRAAGEGATTRVERPRPNGSGARRWPDCRFSYLCSRSAGHAPAIRCAVCPAGPSPSRSMSARRDDDPFRGRP